MKTLIQRAIMAGLAALLMIPVAQAAVEMRTANNGQVLMEDVPEIPQEIRNDLRRYQNVRGAGLVGWTADGQNLYVSTRFAEVNQIHRVNHPGGMREQLTWFDEPVGQVARRPGHDTLAFLMDQGGSEFSQIFLLDPADGSHRMISDGRSRNTTLLWSDDGRWLAFQSTRRNGSSNDVWLWDAESAAEPRLVLESPDGSLWLPMDFLPDHRQLLILQYISINDSRAHVLDLQTGELRRVAGSEDNPSANVPLAFAADGNSIYLTTDARGEFTELARLSLAPDGGNLAIISADIPWSVTEFVLNDAGDQAVFLTNEDGISRLYRLDTRDDSYQAINGIPDGVIDGLIFNPAGDQVGMTLNNAATPSDTYVVDTDTGALNRWTFSEVGGLDASQFRLPELVHYPTFDQIDEQPRKIPAFVYKPDAPGPHPVVISVHGGPEGQARPTFSSTYQLWIDRLGVAVIVPNVRGSSGYGKSYLKLDDGYQREDSVMDIGALLDWIAVQPDLDAARVSVFGGSYGGYMVLASAVHYSDRLKAAVDIVGISNFVTFLENTQEYRRDLRRPEYGDERDPQMREFLQRISPLNNVEKIRTPMFVVQGNNDPRVPVTESGQIVRALRAQGTPVWYMNALNEGHGYRKKENRDLFGEATVLFLQRYLLQ